MLCDFLVILFGVRKSYGIKHLWHAVQETFISPC